MYLFVIGYLGLEEMNNIVNSNSPDIINKISKYFTKHFVRDIKYLNDRFQIKDLKFKEYFDTVLPLNDSIHNVLWELSTNEGLNIELDMLKLPILQETIEVFRLFKVDYFEALSKGSYLGLSNNTDEVLNEMNNLNIPCKYIGKASKGHGVSLIIDDKIRHMSKPKKVSNKDNFK